MKSTTSIRHQQMGREIDATVCERAMATRMSFLINLFKRAPAIEPIVETFVVYPRFSVITTTSPLIGFASIRDIKDYAAGKMNVEADEISLWIDKVELRDFSQLQEHAKTTPLMERRVIAKLKP